MTTKRWMLGSLAAGVLLTAGFLKAAEEGKEVKMKFSEVPAAVQKTLTDEAKGAKIETVDKETDKGKTIYEADVKIDGTNYEIKVAEDGKLISKAVDEEDEKKDEKKADKK